MLLIAFIFLLLRFVQFYIEKTNQIIFAVHFFVNIFKIFFVSFVFNMRDLPAKQKRPLQAFAAALSRNKERNYNCESVLCIGRRYSFLLMVTS